MTEDPILINISKGSNKSKIQTSILNKRKYFSSKILLNWFYIKLCMQFSYQKYLNVIITKKSLKKMHLYKYFILEYIKWSNNTQQRLYRITIQNLQGSKELLTSINFLLKYFTYKIIETFNVHEIPENF